MQELMSGGATVLFVSHDLDKIAEMCDEVVWLERGKVIKIGPAKQLCEEYSKKQLESKQ